MKHSSISIVTISFNQGRFIEECLSSVANQGAENVQHVVVDAGSKDETLEILTQPRWGHVDWKSEKDEGPADGLNNGFSRATGEILAYLNADDTLLPGTLGRVRDLFTAKPEADVIYGDGVLIDGRGEVLRRLHSDPWDLRRFAYGGVLVVQQATFFRRRAFEATGGFNTANRTCWDAELILDMALTGCGIEYVPVPLGAFRIYGDSITGSGRLNHQYEKDRRRLAEKALGRRWTKSDDYRAWFVGLDTRLRKRIPQKLANAVRNLTGSGHARRNGVTVGAIKPPC